MKRPHRRAHLMIWMVLAPLTALAAVYAWTLRPGTPVSDIPAYAETAREKGE